jgi:septum formation protein
MIKIILASESVDRKELLKRLLIPFDVIITNINEEKFKSEIKNPIELVMYLAEVKANAAKNLLKKKNQKDDYIIIAADTVVLFQGEIIGKAKNKDQAFSILKKLNNNTHSLITGIAITQLNYPKVIKDYDKTTVTFLALTDKEINTYIDSNEWKGRAGAYSIEDRASMFIEKIEGSPSNVVGLPLQKIFHILKTEFKASILDLSK